MKPPPATRTLDAASRATRDVTLWAKIAAFSILVAVVAALAIVELHRVARSYDEEEVRLTSVEARAVDLRSATWAAVLEATAPVASRERGPGRDATDGRPQLQDLNRQLYSFGTTAFGGPALSTELRRAATDYLVAATSVREDLAASSAPEARTSAFAADFVFGRFRGLLDDQRATAVSRSERAQAASAWGTVGISVAGAAAICLIAWYMERRHRRTVASVQGRLHQLAYFDALTSLANRAQFTDHLANVLSRPGQRELAVLFLDIDNFKIINDLLGHTVGDAVITEAAARIADAIRPTDLAARLGGDEFAVILDGVGDVEHAIMIANRILDAMKEPCTVQGEQVAVRCSIGVAMAWDGNSAEEIVRNADIAMYAAKARGKACVTAFDPNLHSVVLETEQIRSDLDGAWERGELTLFYQPIVALDTGEIHGIEALIRWNHPRRMVLPSSFIPIAEESGLIVPIGRWALRQACWQLALWRVGRPNYAVPVLHVNVSVRQVNDPDFLSDLQDALDEYAVDPAGLVLEITESVMVESGEAVMKRLEAIREMGVRIAIDDFGTGYSSLRYLQSLPVDIVKIDRSFVQGLRPGTRGAEITRAIVDLAQRLRLQIVAEGIELEQQARMLIELGCREGQGFYFAEAMPVAELEKRLFKPFAMPAAA